MTLLPTETQHYVDFSRCQPLTHASTGRNAIIEACLSVRCYNRLNQAHESMGYISSRGGDITYVLVHAKQNEVTMIFDFEILPHGYNAACKDQAELEKKLGVVRGGIVTQSTAIAPDRNTYSFSMLVEDKPYALSAITKPFAKFGCDIRDLEGYPVRGNGLKDFLVHVIFSAPLGFDARAFDKQLKEAVQPLKGVMTKELRKSDKDRPITLPLQRET
jgi:hypothetical protein